MVGGAGFTPAIQFRKLTWPLSPKLLVYSPASWSFDDTEASPFIRPPIMFQSSSLSNLRAVFLLARSTICRQRFLLPHLPVQHPYWHSNLSLLLCPYGFIAVDFPMWKKE